MLLGEVAGATSQCFIFIISKKIIELFWPFEKDNNRTVVSYITDFFDNLIIIGCTWSDRVFFSPSFVGTKGRGDSILIFNIISFFKLSLFVSWKDLKCAGHSQYILKKVGQGSIRKLCYHETYLQSIIKVNLVYPTILILMEISKYSLITVVYLGADWVTIFIIDAFVFNDVVVLIV